MNELNKLISVIKPLLPRSNVKNVFNQLGKDENDVPYHLHLLNLKFGDEGLESYRKLALNLKDSPKLISELIRDVNWRPTLVGNAITILLRTKEFHKDLIWRLENGSWVSPQIAVGIALLNANLAEKELNKIIENASEESNPKTIMSAYSSLKFLESNFAKKFEQTKLFEVLREKDSWDNSIKIAEQHWNFWKDIEPIT
ncbi:MAG: hypothetical protein M3033_05325 [Acidobacteriota bacterium]|nr:hypothetical protein [Acidobacteriota bacterium]